MQNFLILSFFFELVLLSQLSNAITKSISQFLHKTTRSKKVTVYLIAFIFLPGTIFHELSHWVMAKMLFIPAGKIRLIPEAFKNELKLGSVAIAKCDPFRRFLIGVAPFLFGTVLILTTVYIFLKYELINSPWLLIGILYLVFQISNTMFSSRKDLEGSVLLTIVLCTIFLLLYLAGVRITVEFLNNTQLLFLVFPKINIYLLIPVCVDFAILFILRLLNR